MPSFGAAARTHACTAPAGVSNVSTCSAPSAAAVTSSRRSTATVAAAITALTFIGA